LLKNKSLQNKMKCFFAGYSILKNQIKDIPEAKCLLESYLYFKNKDYEQWHKDFQIENRELFLDSGAFSAFTLKTKIDINDWCKYIKKFENSIDIYANLDVIKNYKATQENEEYMESLGLKPLSTYHIRSPEQELHRLCKKYDYFALGGAVTLSSQKDLFNFFSNCFTIIRQYWPKKIHAFGIGSIDLMKKFPFYSIDNTSWLTGGKFRRILKFNGKNFDVTTKNLNDISVDKMKACEDKEYKYDELDKNNIIEYTKAVEFVTELWRKRGIVFN